MLVRAVEHFGFIFIEGVFGVLFGLGLAWDWDLVLLNERHFHLFELKASSIDTAYVVVLFLMNLRAV